jgi:CRP/FNR family transcriptional regulator
MINKIKKFLQANKDSEPLNLEFYKSIEIFKDLTTKEINDFSKCFITKKYLKDEVIYKENFPLVMVFIIRSGSVKEYIENPLISEVRTLVAGEYFGEIGIFLETNRITSAVTLEETELIAINKTDFRLFIKANPATGIKLLYSLGKSISKELRAYVNQHLI